MSSFLNSQQTSFPKETKVPLWLHNPLFYSSIRSIFYVPPRERNCILNSSTYLSSLMRLQVLMVFICNVDVQGLSCCWKPCIPAPHSDALCLTMWVESAATLHGAILSQFSQLPQAENEQSTDKMRKCIVDCVVYLLYDGIQWKSCRLSAGNQL